jgi:hypothetical protein
MRGIFDKLDDWSCGDNPLGKYECANAHVHLLTLISITKWLQVRKRESMYARMRHHKSRIWLARGETRGSRQRGWRVRSRASYGHGTYSAREVVSSRAPRPTLCSAGWAGRCVNPVGGAMEETHGERLRHRKGGVSQAGVVERGNRWPRWE